MSTTLLGLTAATVFSSVFSEESVHALVRGFPHRSPPAPASLYHGPVKAGGRIAVGGRAMDTESYASVAWPRLRVRREMTL
jgi:hypothetical protein